MDTASPLDRFRAAVMADPAIQQHLAEPHDPADFEQRALDYAAAQDIPISREDLSPVRTQDPLGLMGLMAPCSGSNWPPRAFLPVRVAMEAGFAVDWDHFAGIPLDQPFFEDSKGRIGTRPFNRVFRYRTDFADFVNGAEDALAPTGFIFHMSRCGSTLAAQMLAANPANIVLSEPAPLDSMIQLPFYAQGVALETHVAAIRAMVLAYGRNRSGEARHYFIKTDCWHVFALPLLRLAFPETPWVFLYRDPVEVLVSQARMAGSQVVPGILPPQIFGIDPAEASMPGDDYTARVLASTCNAAIAHWDQGGGLMVNYRELPDALFTRILRHFGIEPSADDRALMEGASRRDAKAPDAAFKRDSATKQAEAGDSILAAAGTHFAGIYEKLEELSASSLR